MKLSQRLRNYMESLNSTISEQQIEIARLHSALDSILAHASDNNCEGSECSICAEIICPEKSTFHFHHDGCPDCAIKEQHEE